MNNVEDLDLDQVREAIAEARKTGDTRSLRKLRDGLKAAAAWRPQQYQQPPPGEWWTWIFSAGRGSGKSDTGAWRLDEHMKGPPCDKRVPGGHKAFCAGPTFGTAVEGIWDAPHGIKVHNPKVRKVGRKEGTFLVWPNGAEAILTGLHTEDDAEKVRAHAANVCTWQIDEGAIAKHLKLAMDNLLFGARLGPHPHGQITSTPKPTPQWKYVLGLEGVVETHASSHDNAYLPAVYRHLIKQYEGTAWGLQEIYGQLVEFFEGALWMRDGIEADSILRRDLPPLLRIMLGIDPSTWQPEFGTDPGTVGEGLETGIVAVGVGREDNHGYVLGDWSGRYGTAEAARTLIRAYHALEDLAPVQAVIERNNDAGIYAATQLIDSSVKFYRDPKQPTRVGVHAADAKRARAEPVSALYDQHKMHHVRDSEHPLALLEGQMVLWDPRERWSPDRLDALVWASTASDLWTPASGFGSTSDLGDRPLSGL